MSPQKLGILFHNKKRAPVNVAVAMAKIEFGRAGHTNGYRPREVYFNPAEAPEESSVGGLTVYTDKSVPLHHLRITTDEIEVMEAA